LGCFFVVFLIAIPRYDEFFERAVHAEQALELERRLPADASRVP
jgi:hypothetical protein